MPLKAQMTEQTDLAGALALGVRPMVDGWYWCQRHEYVAAEIVHVARGRLMSVGGTMLMLAGSSYDTDTTKWYGPITLPACWGKF